MLPWIYAQSLSPEGTTSLIERGGVVALLVLIVVALLKRWVITGPTYLEVKAAKEKAEAEVALLRARSDEWLMKFAPLLQNATEIIEQAMRERRG